MVSVRLNSRPKLDHATLVTAGLQRLVCAPESTFFHCTADARKKAIMYRFSEASTAYRFAHGFTTVLAIVLGATLQHVRAVTLIGGSTNNGNLDRTHEEEVVPGFFLPKPDVWINEGFRSISGPYEDEMSSELWAGPAPTPVTTDGVGNPCSGPDCGVFFKPFSGNPNDGAGTGHLYQDNPATPGGNYTLTGWAGAEANALMEDAEFAVEFLNAANSVIGGSTLS
jgi:hypothetical protein